MLFFNFVKNLPSNSLKDNNRSSNAFGDAKAVFKRCKRQWAKGRLRRAVLAVLRDPGVDCKSTLGMGMEESSCGNVGSQQIGVDNNLSQVWPDIVDSFVVLVLRVVTLSSNQSSNSRRAEGIRKGAIFVDCTLALHSFLLSSVGVSIAQMQQI